MAKDEGKNLGYHWRRSAGVYDDPNRRAGQPKGNASTTTQTLSGLGSGVAAKTEDTAAKKKS